MKKLLFVLAVLLSTQLSHAKFRNVEEWRSTSTCSANDNVLIATGPVFLYEIYVASGNPFSGFTYSNSSTTSSSDVFRSTSVFHDTGTTGVRFPIETTLTRGLVYSKTGTACIRLKWDWYMTPLGRETTGQHRP